MLSYSKGAELPLRNDTIYEAFAAAAGRFPDRLALVSRPDGVRWTYRELQAAVEETARGLAGLGFRAGDRVGIWAPSCAEWILLQLACPRAGIALVNVNPAFRANDLGYILRKSRMRAIFHHARDARADYAAILAEATGVAGHSLERAIEIGTDAWRGMIAGGVRLPETPVDPHSVANIQFTSGTTGNAKGVLLTHHNIVNNACFLAREIQFTENDRTCQTFPLYHCAGFTCSSLAILFCGGAFVLPSRMFDPGATLEAIQAEGVTLLYGVPSMFIAELEHPRIAEFNLHTIRAAVVGGAPCPVELIRRMAKRLGTDQIFDIYGQTEASPVITMSSPADSLEVRAETIGRAGPNTEVKIVDVASGETLPVGQQGELCARGYCVMPGYDEDPEATRKAIDADGWLHTGDLAVMRPDGYLSITGRARDMIIRGGENVYPAEVENLLHGHPKVADAHVLGIPDARLGELVIAWIRLKAGDSASETEIREFCQGKVAHFKVPQSIRFVESFPMTASGKVQKFRIREMELELRQRASVEQARTA
ncbi:MAG TPA: AMP-binding protein [Candidatus Solibacter sp.]|nr:AMP-binding protein [Candidatus Solibacter sp.]